MTLNVPQGDIAELVKIARLDMATDGSPGSYSYEQVLGLKSFTDANAYSTEDTSYFEGGPRGTDTLTQVKTTFSGTLQKFVDDKATHVLLKAAGGGNPATGGFDVHAFRLYARNGVGVSKEFTAQVQWEPQGGGTTNLKTNNFTLVTQELTDGVNPLSVVAALTAATPASMGAGSWIEVVGTGLESVSAVTVGGVAASAFILVNSRKVMVKIPAGSAGSAPIVVTTQAGASNSLAYTRT